MLINSIAESISETDKKTLLRQMGYHNNIEKGHKRLDSLLKAQNLCEWLRGGGYDLNYDNRGFVKKLAEVLSISNTVVSEALEKCDKEYEHLSKLQTPYIFVDTRFERRGQSLIILALTQGLRRITLNKSEVVEKSLTDTLVFIAGIAKDHYKINNGRLANWGTIYSYDYYHTDGSKFVFDTEGKVIGTENSGE